MVEWLEYDLHPWTSYLIVPIFALANAGIALSSDNVAAAATSSVMWGVALGLLVGKPIGVLAASVLAIKTGAAVLPTGVSWAEICGAGLLAGMGFTVSLFIAEIALPSATADHARLGILGSSIVAGSLGFLILRRLGRSEPSESS